MKGPLENYEKLRKLFKEKLHSTRLTSLEVEKIFKVDFAGRLNFVFMCQLFREILLTLGLYFKRFLHLWHKLYTSCIIQKYTKFEKFKMLIVANDFMIKKFVQEGIASTLKRAKND